MNAIDGFGKYSLRDRSHSVPSVEQHSKVKQSNMAPTLYSSSPGLQILCLMPSEQTDTSFWVHQQRIVPIFTTADLEDDEEASDEVREFLGERLPSAPADCVVLLTAEGRGLWTSGEVSSAGIEGSNDGLVKALKDLESSDEGFQDWEEMEME